MIRRLPPEEWGVLGDESAAFFCSVRPEDVAVFVAEDRGVIVGHVAVVRAPFLERWWVDPDLYGNAGVTRGLLRAATVQAREWAPQWVIAHGDNAMEAAMAKTLIRLGGEFLPVHTFMLPLHGRKEAACPQPSRKRRSRPDPTEATCSASNSAQLQPREEVSTCPQP